MKPLIIYHGHCVDGAGAAYAAWCKFGEDAEYRAAQYNDPPPTDEEVRGREVYVLDYAYPWTECERIVHSASRLRLLDHHKTAMEQFAAVWSVEYGSQMRLIPAHATNMLVHLDMNKSGAVLAWEHFHPDIAVPEVLRYVEDRDLWRFKLPKSREVHAALQSRGALEDDGWRAFTDLDRDHFYQSQADRIALLQHEGEILLRGRERKLTGLAALAERVLLMLDHCRRCGARGDAGVTISNTCVPGTDAAGNLRSDHVFSIECPAVNSPRSQSELGGHLAELAEKQGEPPLGVVWWRDGARGSYRVSLRSRGDGLDVSAIAKQWPGGGGHKNAAGFECDIPPWVVVGPYGVKP